MSTPLQRLKDKMADVNALGAAATIMDWDQQTYMPAGGADARAAHVGILSRMRHEIFISDEVGSLIENSSPEGEDDAAYIRVVKRDYEQSTKLPASFVEEKARLATEGHETWVHARRTNSFEHFAPTLAKVVEICQKEAELLGCTDHIYTALLDQYEEGATYGDCVSMFDALRQPLVDLVKDISACPQPDDAFLTGSWNKADQSCFTETLVKAIGFDMNRGRQDVAPHPFCTGWSVGDIRLTTRFQDYLPSAVFGSLHEAGHGMYEQGSPKAWDLTPLAGGVSLGLHESQSRTWENIVGRSRPFWQHFYPQLQSAFPELTAVGFETWIKAVNKVSPSLIRVEADEVTYNLHIMVRFEIECDLLTGTLKIEDLPEAWNAKYESYLGVRPDSNANGCLQDVHWSMGSIGYFPTYSMGNLLSVQIWNKLAADLGDVGKLMAEGNFAPILTWLQEKLYSKGRSIKPKDLVLQITGKPIGAEDYLAHITQKYRGLYGI